MIIYAESLAQCQLSAEFFVLDCVGNSRRFVPTELLCHPIRNDFCVNFLTRLSLPPNPARTASFRASPNEMRVS
jgi:hypothetical protein